MQGRTIYLDHDAVDFVRQSFAFGLFLLDELPNLFEGLCQLAGLVDFEAGRFQGIECFPVAVKKGAAILQQGVAEIVQSALRGN